LALTVLTGLAGLTVLTELAGLTGFRGLGNPRRSSYAPHRYFLFMLRGNLVLGNGGGNIFN
jgi:hypothetical protein